MGPLVITILASLAILVLIGVRGFRDRNAWLSRKPESQDSRTQRKGPPVKLFAPPGYSGRGYDLVKRSLGQYDTETRKAMVEAEAETKAGPRKGTGTGQGAVSGTVPKFGNAAKTRVPPKKTFGRRRRRTDASH